MTKKMSNRKKVKTYFILLIILFIHVGCTGYDKKNISSSDDSSSTVVSGKQTFDKKESVVHDSVRSSDLALAYFLINDKDRKNNFNSYREEYINYGINRHFHDSLVVNILGNDREKFLKVKSLNRRNYKNFILFSRAQSDSILATYNTIVDEMVFDFLRKINDTSVARILDLAINNPKVSSDEKQRLQKEFSH